MKKAELQALVHVVPTQEIYAAWGMLNFAWTRLDLIALGVLCELLDLKGTETTILVGQLDVLQKLEKAQQILQCRHKSTQATAMAEYLHKLAVFQTTRQLLLHGTYIGTSPQGEFIFAGRGQVAANGHGSVPLPMGKIKLVDASAQHVEIYRICVELIAWFDGQHMRELLLLTRAEDSHTGPHLRLVT